MAVNSGFNLDSLMLEVKTAAVYAAHENSMFLGGAIVPVVNTPNGSDTIRVPLIPNYAQNTVQTEDATTGFGGVGVFADDLTAHALSVSEATVRTKLMANRGIMRDTGGISPSLQGEQLGKSLSHMFDKELVEKFGTFATHAAVGTGGTLATGDILAAKTTLMSNAITEDMVAILHPVQAQSLVNDIQTTAYAGGEVQSAALRRGYFGNLYGVDIFTSSYVNLDAGEYEGILMTKDAMKIAMQRNVEVEIARRPEAVGFDVVASLIANSGVIDDNYGVMIKST